MSSLSFRGDGSVFKLGKYSSNWLKISNTNFAMKYNKSSGSFQLIINDFASMQEIYNLQPKVQVNENYSIIIKSTNKSKHALSINFNSQNDAKMCIKWLLKVKKVQISYSNNNNDIVIPAASQSLLFASETTSKRPKQAETKKKHKQTKQSQLKSSYSHETHKRKLRRSQRRISKIKAKFHDREAAQFSTTEQVIIYLVYTLVIIIPIFWFFCFKIVSQFEMGVVLRLGKIRGKALRCGMHIILPFIDDLRIIDMRVQTIKLKQTHILCADGLSIKIKAVIFTQVINPWPVGMGGGNCNSWFRNLAYPILRDVIGKYVLMDLLEGREEINNSLTYLFQKETYRYGVNVCNFEILNMIVPKEQQRSIASAAEAERSQLATVIAAIAEVECADNLNKAAKQMNASKGALILRYLHTINKIGKEQNTTIYFPYLMHFNMFQD